MCSQTELDVMRKPNILKQPHMGGYGAAVNIDCRNAWKSQNTYSTETQYSPRMLRPSAPGVSSLSVTRFWQSGQVWNFTMQVFGWLYHRYVQQYCEMASMLPKRYIAMLGSSNSIDIDLHFLTYPHTRNTRNTGPESWLLRPLLISY